MLYTSMAGTCSERTVIIRDDMSAGRYEQVQQNIVLIGQQVGCRITVIASDGKVLGDNWAESARMENHLTRPEVIQAAALGADGGGFIGALKHFFISGLGGGAQVIAFADKLLRFAQVLRELFFFGLKLVRAQMPKPSQAVKTASVSY